MQKQNIKLDFHQLFFYNLLAFLIDFYLYLLLCFQELITKAIALGFDEKTVKLAAPLVAINFYYLPLIFIVTFMAAFLQYKNHFATTAFSTALLNLALIAAFLVSKDLDKYQITYYLSYGVLIGGFLQVLAHIIAM
ncbi:MAG: lipid II flippase MurJ [Halarcobacter ebronensis]